MQRTLRAVMVALLLAGHAFAPPARADRSVEDRAFTLYREGDYAGAAALLRRMADQPGARPEVHRALASCYLKLRDDERAAAALTAYLAVAPPGPERDQAAARLAEVNERLTTSPVSITSEPPGASVFVDGAEPSAGPTPLSLRLPLGTRKVRLALAGHETADTTVEVKRGAEATVTVRLAPAVVTPAPPPVPAPAPKPALTPPPSPPVVVAPPLPLAPVADVPRDAASSRHPYRLAGVAVGAVAVAAAATGLGLYYGGAVPAAERAGSPTATAEEWLAATDASGHYSGGWWSSSVASFTVAGVAAAVAVGLLAADGVVAKRVQVAPAAGGLEARF